MKIADDLLLIDFVRKHGCYSVKRGCETANCGLCTVFVDDKPVLSCSTLVARVSGHKVDTLEGLQEEAAEFGAFIANQGADIWQEIYAVVPDTKDSSGESSSFLLIKKRKKVQYAGSRTTGDEKRCNGAGNRKTGLYTGCGSG